MRRWVTICLCSIVLVRRLQPGQLHMKLPVFETNEKPRISIASCRRLRGFAGRPVVLARGSSPIVRSNCGERFSFIGWFVFDGHPPPLSGYCNDEM